MEENQPKKNPSEISKVTAHEESTEKKEVAHDRSSRSRETENPTNPHIPISTAKDRKTSFSEEQKKFITKIRKEIKKLEKSINNEFELARQNKEIERNIIDLTEKLVKTRRNRKLFERMDELKALHRRLKRGEQKIDQERDRILTRNRKLEKLRKEILQ